MSVSKLEKVRVAVIGVGSLGQHHARIYADNRSCELVAVVDNNPKVAKEFAKKYKVKGLTDYEQLVGQVDAVSVVVPTFLHHQVASFFLKNDIHVMVEKPITSRVEDAHELISLAHEHGLVLQVGHIERFNQAILQLQKVVTKPAYIEAHRLSPYSGRIQDVGVVLDLMIHDLDIVLQLVNSPLCENGIDAVGIGVYGQHEDIANVRLHFQSGAMATLTASRVSPMKLRKIRIFQANTFISADYVEQSMDVYRRVVDEDVPPGEPKVKIIHTKPEIKSKESLKLELESFLDCVKKHHEPVVKGEHARDALELAVMITEQIKERLQMQFKAFLDV